MFKDGTQVTFDVNRADGLPWTAPINCRSVCLRSWCRVIAVKLCRNGSSGK